MKASWTRSGGTTGLGTYLWTHGGEKSLVSGDLVGELSRRSGPQGAGARGSIHRLQYWIFLWTT